nr:GGDEF domain-containing protein [Maliibacterium massiliense]
MSHLHKGVVCAVAFLLLLAAVAGAAALSLPYADDVRLQWGSVAHASERWDVSVSPHGHTATLQTTLGGTLPPEASIAFACGFMSCRAYLDGALFYTYGETPHAPFQSVLGRPYLVVPLPKDAQGKQLRLELTSVRGPIQSQSASQLARQVYLGARGDILFFLLQKNAGPLFFSAASLLLGLLFLLLAIFVRVKRHIFHAYHGFLFLGMFVLLAGLWIASDATLLQFITGNVQGVFLLSFLCFMLMPLPLLLFVRTTQVHGKAALDICALGLMLNMLLCLALHFGGVAPLSDTVWMTHLWLLGCMVLLFVLCIRERRVYRHTAAREILIALVVLCAGVLLSMVQFYGRPLGDNSFFFRIGLFLFILLLSAAAFRRALAMFGAHAQMDAYKQLAYTDVMTRLGNRTAFAQDQLALQKDPTALAGLVYVMFDINNLKHTNDTRGHAEGDRLIIRAADYIRRAWGKEAACFRIGGDEFVVRLVHTPPAQVAQALSRLEEQIAQQERAQQVALDIVWGYALQRTPPLSPDALLKEADAQMYVAKQRRKAAQAR